MLNKARVRDSKISSVGVIIGSIFFLCFAGVGILTSNSGNSDLVIWVWSIGVVIMVLFSIIVSYENIKSKKGVPHTEIDFESSGNDSTQTFTFDEKLQKINNLKKNNLITEEEFNKKRAEIMKHSW